ncbi:hypothetical protein BYT27DRAFT_7181718 [Phlegmacium glaucopus]|nr:hypothetical protein BYT27DRAFT_7181718 [Phlegmacium glaucopus]
MAVYLGKLNYPPYASNENIIVDLPDGWVRHGRARVWSTWTKNASGTEKAMAFCPPLYVLRDVGDGATTFKIHDLDSKNYYWFTGTRTGDSITLSLISTGGVLCQSNITLALLEKS